MGLTPRGDQEASFLASHPWVNLIQLRRAGMLTAPIFQGRIHPSSERQRLASNHITASLQTSPTFQAKQ